MSSAREGSVSATWTDLGPDLEQAMSDASRSVVESVTAETQSIYQHAHDLWPVKSGRSKASLGWRVEVSAGEVKGMVRAAEGYAKYIQSAQISTSLTVPDARIRAMHRNAKTPEQHRYADRVQADAAKRFRVRAYVQGRGGGKVSGKAAKSGSAMWLLLRWPEKAAGDRLTEALGPIIEADLAKRLEG